MLNDAHAGAEEARSSAAQPVPFSSPDDFVAAGKSVVQILLPVLKTRRGMAGAALACLVLLLFYTTQRGVDSRGVEVADGAGKGHATEKLVERAELEQLVVELMQVLSALVWRLRVFQSYSEGGR